MKNKVHKFKAIVNSITVTQMFKGIFMATILIAFYGGNILTVEEDYFGSVLMAFQFDYFNIAVYGMLFLNVINICSVFDKKFENYIIRLKNKKKYLLELIKIAVLMTFLYLIIFLLLYFMFLNFSQFGYFKIYDYYNYSVSNVVYLIFYMFKYFVLAFLMAILNVILFVNFKEKIVLIFDVIFLFGFSTANLNYEITSKFTLNFWEYFGSWRYSSFMMEINYTILFIFILEFIVYLLYKITCKRKLEIG